MTHSSSAQVSTLSRIALVALGSLLAIAGIGFIDGGAMLILRGGSWYYLLMGGALLYSGINIARGGRRGVAVYSLAFVLTIVWAFWEAGLDFWALHARLFTFLCLFLVMALLLPVIDKRAGYRPRKQLSFALSGVSLVAVIAMGYGMFIPHGVHNSLAATGQMPAQNSSEFNWDRYGASGDENRFAPLDQVNRDTVAELELAWTFRTGEVPQSPGGGGLEDQNTPLQVGNDLYLCTASNTVINVNATTGEENWRHEFPTETRTWVRCRGLGYFDATAPIEQPSIENSSPVLPVALTNDAECQQRIVMNTIDAVLVALDANTGELCASFGNGGKVDLKQGLGDAQSPLYSLTSPPLIAGTTIVVGGRVADNVALDMPGGVMRGFDVITGEMRWAFDPGAADPTIAGDAANETAFTRSTPNVWAPMTYDAESNAVFMPVGGAAIDLWGVDRAPEDEKYGASVLALDASTGEEKWVYQTVHHDLWDFDVPMQPTLIDFTTDEGNTVPALTIGTKVGQIFVLNRATGEPLTEVKEMPVKAASIPDEKYSLTQPVSVGMPQIGAATLTEADMWGATPFDQLMCRVIFKGYRYEGLFTAPDTDYSLSMPGSLGGLNWGGMSYDPTAKTLYVNDMRLGLWVHMMPQEQGAEASNGSEAVNTVMGGVPLKGTPYSVNKNRFLSPLGIPCQEPPFGTLTAINMDTQTVNWEVPLGTVQDTVLFGTKMHLPMPVGMPTIGGSMVTQGGLVFFAATQDYWLRAFDSASGELLWKARLPVGSQGTPMSYISPEDGRQYIVISAGGARQSEDRGDYVLAYALPK